MLAYHGVVKIGPDLYNNAIITIRNLALSKKLIETWKYLKQFRCSSFLFSWSTKKVTSN